MDMQLAERIFVKENPAMADLCRKQTTLYNQALFYLRQEEDHLGDLNVKYLREDHVYGEICLETGDLDITKKNEQPKKPRQKRDKKKLGFKKKEEIQKEKESGNIKEKKPFIPIPGKLTYYDLNDKAMLKWAWFCPACFNVQGREWKRCSGHSEEIAKRGTCPWCGSPLRLPYRDAIPGFASGTIKQCTVDWEAAKAAIAKYKGCAHPRHVLTKLKGKARHRCPGCHFIALPRIPNYKSPGAKTTIQMAYTDFSIMDHEIHFTRDVFAPVYAPRLADQKRGDSSSPVSQIRIVPAYGGYWVECVHDVEIIDVCVKKENVMGIDPGKNYLCTIVDNLGSQPVAFSGSSAKNMNRRYTGEVARIKAEAARCNPRIAELQRLQSLHEIDENACELTHDEMIELRRLMQDTTQVRKITEHRNRQIKTLFHKLSSMIIDLAVERKICRIIIGHNKDQKQGRVMGKMTRREFNQLPIFQLFEMIGYKAALVGIDVIETSEEYTSIASFLDLDALPDRESVPRKSNGHSDIKFSGKRGPRGLYTSKNGTQIHADVNAAYNILRKGVPEAFGLTGQGVTTPMALNGSRVRLYPKILDIPVS
jgi:IS605 OrfB family transposase